MTDQDSKVLVTHTQGGLVSAKGQRSIAERMAAGSGRKRSRS